MNGPLFWIVLATIYIAPNLRPSWRLYGAWVCIAAAVVEIVIARMK
jgi:hypothetical protein